LPFCVRGRVEFLCSVKDISLLKIPLLYRLGKYLNLRGREFLGSRNK